MSTPELTLIGFALPEEARPLQRRLGGQRDVRVLVHGMGPARARRALEAALAEVRPARVLSCGFAGGLDPALRHGEVVLEAAETFPGRARLLAAGARSGRFHSSDQIVVTAAAKAALRAATGADAVEMESAALAAVCRAHGLPCATLRVISDTAEEDLPVDFNRWLTPDGRLDGWRLAGALLRRPGLIGALLRLRRVTHAAAQRLAEVLAAAMAPETPPAAR